MNASPVVGSTSSLPSDAEIEAEAERERERGRREAERILAMERMKAEDRMTVEQRVLAMLQSEQGRAAPLPTPSRPQSTQPSTTPSPSASQRDSGGWWMAAKNKLTPTKDPLTPAQQIIQETKSREKEKEKERKAQKKERRSKSKDSEGEWPSSPERKYADPAYMKLNVPQTPATAHHVQQRSSSPSSPTPLRHSNPPSLAPSPIRGADNKASPPLYAQFSSDGVLDVPSTLLAVARRFEKLEKWTVSHVRALEERMDDVEKWLVEKEKEKETQTQHQGQQSHADLECTQDISDIREEMTELQGRMSEIGREMAKLATSPSLLSNAPSRGHAIHRVPSSSEIAVRSMTASPTHAYPIASSQEPTSPPSIAPLIPTSSGSRTRLPYPTGDYATPPDTVILAQGHFSSPPHSPPSSVLSNSVTQQLSGLPTGLDTPASNISGLPGHSSPLNGFSPQPKATPSPSLPPPKKNDFRHSSVSPTPRKRYTVALGGPIVDPDRRRNSPSPIEQPRSVTPLYLSATDEESDDFQEETVGKSSGRKVNLTSLDRGLAKPVSKNDDREPTRVGRPRPQSTYGAPTAPLIPRVRSRSTAGMSLGMDGDMNGSNTSLNKFVDPLLVRKQEKEKETQQKAALTKPMAVRAGGGKKAVRDLAAFFDGGEK